MSMQPVFKRYLRPEKEYLSFSLIYNNGERSLDLVGEIVNFGVCCHEYCLEKSYTKVTIKYHFSF